MVADSRCNLQYGYKNVVEIGGILNYSEKLEN